MMPLVYNYMGLVLKTVAMEHPSEAHKHAPFFTKPRKQGGVRKLVTRTFRILGAGLGCSWHVDAMLVKCAAVANVSDSKRVRKTAKTGESPERVSLAKL
jgi:hypothetical protein